MRYFKLNRQLHAYSSEKDTIYWQDSIEWNAIDITHVCNRSGISEEDLREYVLNGSDEDILYIKMKYNTDISA